MTVLELLVSARLGADLMVAVFFKASVVLAIAALVTRAFAASSASARHGLWTAALLGVGMLPLIEIFGPSWSPVSTLAHYPAETAWVGSEAVEAFAGAPYEPASAGLPLASMLLLVWWAGVVVLATRWCADLVRVQVLRRRSSRLDPTTNAATILDQERRRLGIRRNVELGLVPDEGFAATVGWGRPLIVLGPDVAALPPEALRSVLVHELAHVRRHDAFTHALTALAVIPAWPNPLVWSARRRLIDARERACDDRVLSQGIYASDYARVLLAFASPGAEASPALRSSVGLRFSSTRGRLDAILDPDVPRYPSTWPSTAAVLTGFLSFAVVLGSVDLLSSQPGTGATEELIRALGHEDSEVRTRAARTLSRREASSARLELEALLDDPSKEVRVAAMSALEQLAHPASLDAMAHVLERPFDGGSGESGFVLKLAMRTLGAIATPEAGAVLDAQVERPVEQLRWLALETWLDFDATHPTARERLRWMAEHDPSDRNRRLARQRLQR
ncbi:MAG: M56 family metallopeptidase [Gemmatimonadota bacterium]